MHQPKKHLGAGVLIAVSNDVLRRRALVVHLVVNETCKGNRAVLQESGARIETHTLSDTAGGLAYCGGLLAQ